MRAILVVWKGKQNETGVQNHNDIQTFPAPHVTFDLIRAHYTMPDQIRPNNTITATWCQESCFPIQGS